MDKKTCALVGFSPISRHLAPWDDESITIIGINEEYSFDWFKRKEKNLIWLQLHSRELITRPKNHNDPKHWEWLQKKHPFPIYLQEKWEDIPSAEKYPYQEIRDMFRGDIGENYYTSTLAHMLAFAAYLGFERIELYGFEMASGTEYAYQRPCACYWIGKLRARGIEVYIPPLSGLLTGVSYAYKSSTEVGLGQEIDYKIEEAHNKQRLFVSKYNMARGEMMAIEELLKLYPNSKLKENYPAYEKKVQKFMVQASKYQGVERGLNVAKILHRGMSKLEDGSRNV